MDKSISFMHLKIKVTAALNNMYGVLSSLHLTEEYLQLNLGDKKIMDVFGSEFPFAYFNKSLDEYKDLKTEMAETTCRGTYVTLISTFEDYAYDVLRRYFTLNSEKIKEESAQTTFADLHSYVSSHGPMQGLIENLVDKKLRNKKTTELLGVIASYCKSGVATKLADEVKRVDEHSLVRNAIIHNDGYITNDLVKFDPAKYGATVKRVSITFRECIDLSHLIFKITKEFELQLLPNVIKEADIVAICKEIYIKTGDCKPAKYKKIIKGLLGIVVRSAEITHYLSELDSKIYDVRHEQYRAKLDWLINRYVT